MAGTRKDIATLGGDWPDELLWYARAVAELRTRPLTDRTSWAYLAALHGLNGEGWIDQGILPQNTPAPPPNEMQLMFNQCQHAGWFFLPWHRGYLAAFEAILGGWIAQQGGPQDWALPYWNYLSDAPGARDLPPAFRDATLPDGTPNALARAVRGPATTLGPLPWTDSRDITLASQTAEAFYTSDPGGLGYGGPISGFASQGNAFGAVENDPHNLVHVMIGGGTAQGQQAGWMLDPDFAALDPVFWVHHCNIDRLWAAWMTDPTHVQEVSAAWGNGPFPRRFAMPSADGSGIETFAPEETLPNGALAPDYDDLTAGTGILPAPEIAAAAPPARPPAPLLIGANDAPLTVDAEARTTQLALRRAPVPELASAVPARVFLSVEGVRGQAPSGVLRVSVSAPGGEEAFRTAIAFFGLGKASRTDGSHAGNGLAATVDVSAELGALLAEGGAALDALDLALVRPTDGEPPITVDRISLHTQPGA